MNKLTYKLVEDQFDLRGYKLLSKKYKSNRIKLDYVCSEGHYSSCNSRANSEREWHEAWYKAIILRRSKLW